MKERSEFKTQYEYILYLISQSKHSLTVGQVRQRLYKKWTPERIVSTGHLDGAPVPRNHPLKRGSYLAVAKRKGWMKQPEKTL